MNYIISHKIEKIKEQIEEQEQELHDALVNLSNYYMSYQDWETRDLLDEIENDVDIARGIIYNLQGLKNDLDELEQEQEEEEEE